MANRRDVGLMKCIRAIEDEERVMEKEDLLFAMNLQVVRRAEEGGDRGDIRERGWKKAKTREGQTQKVKRSKKRSNRRVKLEQSRTDTNYSISQAEGNGARQRIVEDLV